MVFIVVDCVVHTQSFIVQFFDPTYKGGFTLGFGSKFLSSHIPLHGPCFWTQDCCLKLGDLLFSGDH